MKMHTQLYQFFETYSILRTLLCIWIDWKPFTPNPNTFKR